MKAKFFLNLGRSAGIIMGAGFALTATAATPSFSAQQTFSAGSFPYGIATGDLNGDGIADMVTTNAGDGTVSVYLNTTPANASSPSYAPQAVFPVGAHPDSVAIADVNGDGLPDLITANSVDGTISILLNTTAPGASTPSFFAPQVLPVGMDPETVLAADMNGDGSIDIVVGNFQDGTITVMLNATAAGSGTVDFSNQQTFLTMGDPLQVVVADVNGDGIPDLVAVNYGNGSVTVMLNTTTQGSMIPSFTDPQNFTDGGVGDGISLAAIDVNGDGLPDIAVVDQTANTVEVLVNTTAPGSMVPNFAAPQSFAVGNGPVWVIAADVNGDALPDLVVANSLDNTITVLTNTTAPNSQTVSFDVQPALAVGSYPQGIAAVDVNGDGKLDLIVTNNDDLSVSVLLNTTP